MRWTVGGGLFAILALVGWLAAGCAPSGRDEARRMSAILITIDTWRADSFGAGGSPLVRTPHLDRFFRRSFQFAEAYAPVPTTLASHVSLLTGLWPTRHGVPRNLFEVPRDLETVSEILSRAGFRTAAFVSSAALDVSFGLDQGFDVYDSEAPILVKQDYPWRPAAMTLARARAWWSREERPGFLWVHLFEPHFPYDPAPADIALYDTGYEGPANGSMEYLSGLWRSGGVTDEIREHVISLYHAEITGLDRALGEFLAEIPDPETMVILTADHGESLGEYGVHFLHGPSVFPHDLRVPLAVQAGPPLERGLSTSLVRLIDVPAAILSQLGVHAELPEEAGNLEEWVTGDEGLAAFGVASMPKRVEVAGEYRNSRKQRVVRTSERAVVKTPWTNRTVWFDRDRDPAELEPQESPPDSVAGLLAERLDEWIEDARPLEPPEAIDPHLEKRLRSLGYVR